MSHAWHPGQLLFVGFEGTSVPRDLAELIRDGRVGGVILFSRNLRDPDDVRQLTASLRGLAPPDAPLVVGLDQEGGLVQRLRAPFTEWPPMRDVGTLGDFGVTRSVGEALGKELAQLGIALNFAPVVDVDSNPDNPVIGNRSFSRDTDLVGQHAAALIGAMQSQGVAACAKHFPGHGDTSVDSHFDLPRLNHNIDRLRKVELPPFRAAIDAGVATVMTAHVLFEQLDAKRPATMSPEIMSLLRDELAFEGLIFTDDLEMKAVSKRFTPTERVHGPLEAGCDVLLVCRQADLRVEMLRVLERCPDRLIENGLQRMVTFKEQYAGLEAAASPSGPPYVEHQKLAEEIRREAGTKLSVGVKSNASPVTRD